jgi:hypothetical protein
VGVVVWCGFFGGVGVGVGGGGGVGGEGRVDCVGMGGVWVWVWVREGVCGGGIDRKIGRWARACFRACLAGERSCCRGRRVRAAR